ncbi:MAG: EAL domain-containing protein [Nitrosomonas sp.]|nr:EAL domain-containing protein [Nitrosomonas sp.]MCW5606840.1 EAL domain-containing protein [Nitrosomonas sp.]
MNSSATQSFVIKDEFELIRSATDFSLERAEDGWISGHYFRCKLTSAFQPVFSITRNTTIGHAAYIRSQINDEIALWPWQVFSQASTDAQLVELDRLCRAVHALNYFKTVSDSEQLFLVVHPRLLGSVKTDHGRTFENFLDLIGVRTSRVTIEIPPIVNRDPVLLYQVINNYRARSYQVAANYTPTGTPGSFSSVNWLTRAESLTPDIVRIDADELFRDSGADTFAENAIRAGLRLLVWNIDTPRQLAAARDIGADYLQGNYLGSPVRAASAVSPQLVRETLQAETARKTSP